MRLFTWVLDLDILEIGPETEFRIKNSTNNKTGKTFTSIAHKR